MKTASPALQAHLGEDCTTLAVLWKVTRTDGEILGFTTHDRDIVFDDVTYLAATGFTHSASESKSDFSVDNLEVTGFLDSNSLTEADIRAGLYDNAAIDQRIVNWNDLDAGSLIVRAGTLGNVRMVNGAFTAELRGLSQKLTTQLGSTYGPTCRAELGSAVATPPERRPWVCGINLSDYEESGAVDSSPDARRIVPAASPGLTEETGYFDGGVLTFTSGNLEGRSFEIKTWAEEGSPPAWMLTMFLPLPEQPADGSDPSIPADTFTITPGCDHTTYDCKNKFNINNIANFRGEPFIPGVDVVMQYPDSKA